MANFEPAFAFILSNEAENGSNNNYGLSSELIDGLHHSYFSDIREVDIKIARNIYYKEFWLRAAFTSIWNQRIANYIFDCCVQHGVRTGIQIAQRALWAILGYEFVLDDGILDKRTLGAIHQAGYHMTYSLPPERACWCKHICMMDDKKDLLKNWLKRCYRI